MLKIYQSLVFMIIATGLFAQPVAGPPSCRDLYSWPYAQNSIWNTPIGTGAQYHPQPVSPSHIDGIQADNDIIVLRPNAPKMKVFGTKWRWQGGTTPQTRCEKYNNTVHLNVPIPSNYVTLFYKQEKPNNAGIVMLEDGETLIQIQPFQACGGGYATSGLRKSGGKIIDDLIRTEDLNIKGDGRTGMHGGSGLNTMGGAIRMGELTSPHIDAMRHALKISFPGDQYLYYDHGKNKGYRWPAWKHDTGADRDYNSSNKEAYIGCLRALKPDLDINSLGLETLPGKKLAWTLQNYGAYQVEGVPWQRMMIAVEEGPEGAVVLEFLDHYGWEFVSKNKTGNPWVKDCLKIIQHLYIVKNNTQATPGGGGTPLQPLAPPFCDGSNPDPDPDPDPEPDPEPASSVKINFQPSSSQTPTGYIADNGAGYANRNGYTYGWLGGNSGTRERGNSSDLKLRTLNHLQKDGNKTWEIAVANGEYDVVLACGDAQYTNQVNNINLEGVQLTDPDGEDNFDIFTQRVTVSDGKLTLSAGNGASNAKVCYIDIDAVEGDDMPMEYTLTVNSGIGDGDYEESDVVNITADAAPAGQEFDMWTGDVSGIADVNSEATSITMPGSDVTITATYKDLPVAMFSLVVNSGIGDGDYAAGTSVNITADAAPAGQEFDMWTGDVSGISDVNSGVTNITMPASDVTITATYKDIAPSTGGPLVKVNFQPSGSVPSGYIMDKGDAFGNRNGFSYGWLGGKNSKTRRRSGGDELKLRTLNHMNNGGNKTWEIAVQNGTYQLEIGCGDAQYSDQVNTINVEGTIITDPDGQDNFDVYNVTVTVNDGRLTIKPASGANNPKICYIDINTSGNTPPAPMEYTLTVNNGNGDGSYEAGTNVNITANAPSSGQEFDKWTGDVDGVNDVTDPITSILIPTANVTITATYKDIPSDGDCTEDFSMSIEAEASGNTLNGTARTNNKSAASGGQVIGYLGKNSNNYLIINNINAPCDGDYTMEVAFVSGGTRTIFITVNDEAPYSKSVTSGSWNAVSTFSLTIPLKAGSNSIKFHNDGNNAPDIDKITIGAGSGGDNNPPPPPSSGSSIKIMPMGDSITAGSSKAGGHYSYRGNLYKKAINDGFDIDFVGPNKAGVDNKTNGDHRKNVDLTESIPDIDHAGYGGHSSGPDNREACWGYFDNCKLNLYDNINTIMASDPDIVLLMLGTNISGSLGAPGGVQTEKDRLKGLVNKIIQIKPSCVVLFGGAPPSRGSSSAYGYTRDAAQEIGNKSNSDNIYYVDLAGANLQNGDFADNVHLTQSGAAKISGQFYKVLKPILQSWSARLSPDAGQQLSDNLMVYPNPARSIVNFSRPATITFYNLLGVRVKSVVNKTQVDISGMEPGLYHLVSPEGRSIRLMIE